MHYARLPPPHAHGSLALLFILSALWMGALWMMIVRMMGVPEDSWVAANGINRMDDLGQLQWAFFKALYTMIGGEEMLPSGVSSNCAFFRDANSTEASTWCTVESWFSLLCLLLGSTLYAFFISSMSSIVLRLDMAGRNFNLKIDACNQYMRAKQLPLPLRDDIRSYYRETYKDGKVFDEDEIMQDMSKELRENIMKENCRDILKRVPLLDYERECLYWGCRSRDRSRGHAVWWLGDNGPSPHCRTDTTGLKTHVETIQ